MEDASRRRRSNPGDPDGGMEALSRQTEPLVYYTKEGDKTNRQPVESSCQRRRGDAVIETLFTRTFSVGNKGFIFVPHEKVRWRSSIRFFDFDTGKIREIAMTERQVFWPFCFA